MVLGSKNGLGTLDSVLQSRIRGGKRGLFDKFSVDKSTFGLSSFSIIRRHGIIFLRTEGQGLYQLFTEVNPSSILLTLSRNGVVAGP